MRILATGLLALLLSASAGTAQEKVTVPPGTPVTIVVKPAEAASPKVSISLDNRHAHAHPNRVGFTHTGGGNIDVQQPSSDALVITMTGVAVAGAHPTKASVAGMEFEVMQCLEINFDNPKVKKAKLSMEGRVIGLLRSHCKRGSADHGVGCATIAGGSTDVLSLTLQAHGVSCGDNQSINCHEGPVTATVGAGSYTLHQSFSVSAQHPRGLAGKASSAEFAPDAALDPLWISYWEPFKGASKKDFGFQVTIKVAADE